MNDTLKKLNQLKDELKGKAVAEDMLMKNIVADTVRTVSPDMAAENGQFTYRDGNPVKDGTSYHIHYTKDLNEYYMTGKKHDHDNSQLIYPTKLFTDFSVYNSINKQSIMHLKPSPKPPTIADYKKGYFKRTFARKANESNTPIFEIEKKYENKSPLYQYVSVVWYIKGKKDVVGRNNKIAVNEAAKTFPSIVKFLSLFQYYKSEEKDETKEDILAKLGFQNVGPNTQKSDGQTTTTDGKSRTSTPEDYEEVEFDEDY